MVTGDHPITAKAIARQVHIIKESNVIHLINLETDQFPTIPLESKAIVIHG